MISLYSFLICFSISNFFLSKSRRSLFNFSFSSSLSVFFTGAVPGAFPGAFTGAVDADAFPGAFTGAVDVDADADAFPALPVPPVPPVPPAPPLPLQFVYFIFLAPPDNSLSLKMREGATASIKEELIYKCVNCGFEEEYNSFHKDSIKTENCIYKNYYDKNKILESNENITNYLDKDPTLPRVSNITCPNDECITNTTLDSSALLEKSKKPKSQKIWENKNEVVYLIINEQDMIFQYFCCNCKTSWTNR